MSTRLAGALAAAALGSVMLATPASAGTTWASVSATAVTSTQNGTTWASLSGADPHVLNRNAQRAPRCASLSFWKRVAVILGGGGCR